MDGRLWVDGDNILAQSSNYETALLMGNITGAKPAGKFRWRWPKSIYVAGEQGRVLHNLYIETDEEWLTLWEEWEKHLRHVQIKNSIDPPPHMSKTDSWLHQRQAFHFLYSLPGAGLFLPMGMGKSKVVVDLVQAHRYPKVLIVTLAKAVEDGLWSGEFERHGLGQHNVLELTGPIRDRAWQIQYADYQVAVTNYEALDYKEFKTALDKVKWDLTVLDESHRIKAPAGVRSKWIASFARRQPWMRRMILTGTPAADKPLDVWGQMRFLQPEILGPRYTDFKHRFANIEKHQTREGQTFEKIKSYRNLDLLSELVGLVSYRADEATDLPPQLDVVRKVKMSPNRWDHYVELREESVALWEAGETIAQNPLTRYLRLQELTSGYLRDDESGELTRFGQEKSDVTLELLEQTDDPVVVFCRFTEDIDHLVGRIFDETPRAPYILDGRKNELAAWRRSANGVLLVQVAAGSEGINLIHSNYVIYYSSDFSLTKYDQSRKRVHRPGQTRPCTYYHLLMAGTVDEYIHEALSTKQGVADYVHKRIILDRKPVAMV